MGHLLLGCPIKNTQWRNLSLGWVGLVSFVVSLNLILFSPRARSLAIASRQTDRQGHGCARGPGPPARAPRLAPSSPHPVPWCHPSCSPPLSSSSHLPHDLPPRRLLLLAAAPPLPLPLPPRVAASPAGPRHGVSEPIRRRARRGKEGRHPRRPPLQGAPPPSPLRGAPPFPPPSCGAAGPLCHCQRSRGWRSVHCIVAYTLQSMI
jgi:hypothetical protein